MFCKDLNASVAAKILGINRNTINRYYALFREVIFKIEGLLSGKKRGIFEADESYFGPHRIRGLGGRGAGEKIPVFGLLKRGGTVFVTLVKNCTKEELLPLIRGHVQKGSTIHTNGWKAYDSLILDGYKHYRVHHAQHEFVKGKSHVNGIESFWSFAKRRLAKFNGLPAHKFFVHLKECEFRFNHRRENLEKILLQLMRKRGIC